MPWVRFIEDFDFKPKPSVTIGYRAGRVELVTTACADLAIGKGKAVKTPSPKKKAVGNAE